MTHDYALADLTDRRWDGEAPLEGDPDSVTDAAVLLARVRHAWSSFVSLFLVSGSEARSGYVRRDPWRRAARWLRSIEDMARGLLLVMALAAPGSPPSPSRAATAAPQPHSARKPDARPPRRRLATVRTYLSVVAWLAPPSGDAGEGAPAAASAPRLEDRWHTLRGLALRMEAVLRVLNDPAPFARRVAQRLDGASHPLACPDYPPPPAVRDDGRNHPASAPPPAHPYRPILAPLWAHCAGLVAARERPG
ncbi:MAG: hypothetical protein GC155_16320 [Alphaproteobacteria bacterium]|nr:hypothetical protein [Alphaproteobacteria bacterium]